MLSKITFNIFGMSSNNFYYNEFILSGFDQVHLENFEFHLEHISYIVDQNKTIKQLDCECVIYFIN